MYLASSSTDSFASHSLEPNMQYCKYNYLFATGAIAAFFGGGTGIVEVECSGVESRLIDCRTNLVRNCRHHDAGVRCNLSNGIFLIS